MLENDLDIDCRYFNTGFVVYSYVPQNHKKRSFESNDFESYKLYSIVRKKLLSKPCHVEDINILYIWVNFFERMFPKGYFLVLSSKPINFE